MRIDIEKATKKLIILCWLTILVCLVLKFFGYKGFIIPALNYNPNIWIKRIVNLILFAFNGICISLIVAKRKFKIYELVIIISLSTIDYIITYNIYNTFICSLIDLAFYSIINLILIRDKWYKILLETILVSIIIMVYQFLTIMYKNITLSTIFRNNSFIVDKILQVDYYILILLTVIHNFKKGGYIYGRWWKKFLVFLSKRKGTKQPLSENNSSIQQRKKTNDVGFKLFIVMLSVFQISFVGVACYFINNVILEYFIVIISFFIMRQCFGKSYHADSVIKCTTLSLFVFVCATRLSPPIYISVMLDIMIGCLVAYIMHIWYYYIKYTTTSGITIAKGMQEKELIELKNQYNLTELEYNIMNDYYVKRHKLDRIAIDYSYSVDNIKKIKANALKKINQN